jgi:hypothetical protein
MSEMAPEPGSRCHSQAPVLVWVTTWLTVHPEAEEKSA